MNVCFQQDPKDTPPPKHVETRDERMERKRREKAEQIQYKLEQEIAMWDPHNSTNATSDPYKTLFVARINYDTSESKLRREFEIYGPIKKVTCFLLFHSFLSYPLICCNDYHLVLGKNFLTILKFIKTS